MTGEARIIQQGSLRRLQTIYRTNLQSAYMAGRHRQAVEQIERAPFAQYLAVRDSRTRPSHAALHGKVFRIDSPEWSVIAPPSSYNCRCRARYMSQDELDARGLKLAEDVRILERMPERPVGDVLTGEAPEQVIERGVSVQVPKSERYPDGRATLWVDRGWDHLPGGSGVERALIDRLMTRADAVGGAGSRLRQVILDDLAARSVAYVRAAAAAGAAKQSAYVLAPSLSRIAARAQDAGIDKTDLRRAALVLDHDRVRKILLRHGEAATEGPRGQRPVTPEDFARIPEVLRLAGPGAVRPGSPAQTNSGQRIQVEADLDGEHWTLVLEVRNKQHTAAVQALWIRPLRAP